MEWQITDTVYDYTCAPAYADKHLCGWQNACRHIYYDQQRVSSKIKSEATFTMNLVRDSINLPKCAASAMPKPAQTVLHQSTKKDDGRKLIVSSSMRRQAGDSRPLATMAIWAWTEEMRYSNSAMRFFRTKTACNAQNHVVVSPLTTLNTILILLWNQGSWL